MDHSRGPLFLIQRSKVGNAVPPCNLRIAFRLWCLAHGPWSSCAVNFLAFEDGDSSLLM